MRVARHTWPPGRPLLILLGPFFQWDGAQGCERGVTEISPQSRHSGIRSPLQSCVSETDFNEE